MILDISYWAWFGLLYLLILTYKDLRNKRIVDTRYNYIMVGVSLSLTSHVHFTLWYIAVLLVIVFGMGYFLNKYKAIGMADIQSLYWIFLGLAILNLGYLAAFTIVFIVLTLFYVLLQVKLLKLTTPAPFYPVILCSFFLVSIMFGLF